MSSTCYHAFVIILSLAFRTTPVYLVCAAKFNQIVVAAPEAGITVSRLLLLTTWYNMFIANMKWALQITPWLLLGLLLHTRAGVNTYRAVKYSDTSGGDWIVLPGAGGGLEHLVPASGTKAEKEEELTKNRKPTVEKRQEEERIPYELIMRDDPNPRLADHTYEFLPGFPWRMSIADHLQRRRLAHWHALQGIPEAFGLQSSSRHCR
ncbi:hypothetical protein C8R44DRAFT_896260 [Mycena epipterygia]|nr:hypothetical protein C8R44DRAFT_896260 [Mycena epipterygia]